MKLACQEMHLIGTSHTLLEEQYVGHINKSFSELCHMEHGPPQGLIVGPGSFKIYTIPIGRNIRKHKISYHVYADFIQLYLKFVPSIQCALSRISACTTEVKLWMTVLILIFYVLFYPLYHHTSS